MKRWLFILFLLLWAVPIMAQDCTPCNSLTNGVLDITAPRGQVVTLTWEYPAEKNGQLVFFRIRRSQTPSGAYFIMADKIDPIIRQYQFILTSESHVFASSVYQVLGTRLQAIRAGGISVPNTTGWSDDMNYSGGVSYSPSVPPAVDIAWQRSAGPVEIYQKQRQGTFNYTLYNLTVGTAYLLRLHFAELTHDTVGQRSFNVLVNNKSMLTEFDIIKEAGTYNRAIARQYFTNPRTDGTIFIDFQPGSADIPILSGIELYSTADSYQVESPGSNQAVAKIQQP